MFNKPSQLLFEEVSKGGWKIIVGKVRRRIKEKKRRIRNSVSESKRWFQKVRTTFLQEANNQK